MNGAGAGHGKVILLGEHAVVHGHAALAGALALGVSAAARPAGRLRLLVPAWGVDSAAEPTGAPARALDRIAATLGIAGPAEITARATVPPRAGLGSSAALAVAVTRALLALEGRAADPATVGAAADAAERVFHGNPSGIDVALATSGGLGLFRRGRGLEPLATPPFRLAIGLSSVPRDTATLVARVAARRAADPPGTEALLRDLGALSESGAAALRAGDPLALGPLFDRAHLLLCALGVSIPALDRLVELARRAGASGAKLTGGGGGGAVIAIGAEEAVTTAWRTAGFDAMVALVGSR